MINWNTMGEVPRIAPMLSGNEKAKPLSTPERGRCAILVGWIITMFGIVGYVVAMSRAPDKADMIDALTDQGLFGW